MLDLTLFVDLFCVIHTESTAVTHKNQSNGNSLNLDEKVHWLQMCSLQLFSQTLSHMQHPFFQYLEIKINT